MALPEPWSLTQGQQQGRARLTVCTPAPPQTCPCQDNMSLLSSAPQPMPSVLPSSFAKLLFLLKPPKTKAREDYSSLLCRALHHKTAQPEMLQKSQRGTKNQDCRASVPSCPPECTGSQVKQHLSTWSTGQAAGFSWASQRKQQAQTHTHRPGSAGGRLWSRLFPL